MPTILIEYRTGDKYYSITLIFVNGVEQTYFLLKSDADEMMFVLNEITGDKTIKRMFPTYAC